jgi:glycosyltransferase involved in cell wall biosynthesis
MTNDRAVLLHYSAFPVVGGVEHVMAEHERLLAAGGYPVQVIAGRGDPSSQIILPELDSAHPRVRAVLQELVEGRFPEGFAALQSDIREALAPYLERADVVILHNVLHLHLNLPLTAALQDWMDENPEQRVISWCHDISRHLRSSRGQTPRRGYPWDLLRRRMPETTYIAVSSARRDRLAEIFDCQAEAIRVIPNGVDPKILLGLSETGRWIADRIQWSSAELILLLPVRMTRAKNLEFALHLTAALIDAGIKTRMIVSGPPDPHTTGIRKYVHQLRRLRKTLGLHAAVYFLFEERPCGSSHPEGVTDGVMGELYRLCDIVLMPSLREGFGMPILEAGLAGRTVFATRMPVFETINPGWIHIIEKDEPPEITARRIGTWMKTDRIYQFRRSIRKNLTWDAVFRRHIRSVVSSPTEKGIVGA